MSEDNRLSRKIAKLQIGNYERHIFFCAGDKCCSSEIGDELWDFLKDELKKEISTQTRQSVLQNKGQMPAIMHEGAADAGLSRRNLLRPTWKNCYTRDLR